MKITAIAMMAAGGMSAQVGGASHTGERKVTVCMAARVELDVGYARDEARKMFAQIGVDIEWRDTRKSCPPDGLLVSLDSQTPASFYPKAFAYALPYEGTNIHVFYDRVQAAMPPGRVKYLLAHVLAHEITHILEGVVRHSTSGVMKAPWDANDFQQMAWKPLPFAPEDIDLIHRGLEGRARKLCTRKSAPIE